MKGLLVVAFCACGFAVLWGVLVMGVRAGADEHVAASRESVCGEGTVGGGEIHRADASRKPAGAG